jgi:hypothetical protein
MRRTLPVGRTGLSVAAALVLLTACGGSGNENNSSPAAGDSASSAPETSSGASSSQFCTEAAAVQEKVGSSISGGSEPERLPDVLTAAATEIRAIEAPEAISADWASFAEGIEQIAAAARIDFNDQAAVATFQQKANALQQKYGTAFTNVENYLREECQLTDSSTETSAPTS